MNTSGQRKYPIGIQTFSKIREGNYLYIDKTELIYRIAHSDSNYMFLSRPRRFGKSLLISTLQCYFEGRRELFDGLAIDRLETEWTAYPVLRFDMSTAKNRDKEGLESELNLKLSKYEAVYGRGEAEKGPNQRLQGLIERAYQQTGRQVVVLIDEYDAPLLDVVHEDRDLPVLRNVMRNFYSPLKACDPYLRFVFLTGITKFSQLSIFSELNNIQNISMLPEYAAICGITQEEMEVQMSPDLDVLAARQKRNREETLQRLKTYYDGYHFTWPSPDIYNPFSLLNAFSDGRLNSYWFGSGTPTYLIEMLNKYHVIPQEIGGRWVAASAFDAPTERMTSITPLLYQSGYITIKDYDELTDKYTRSEISEGSEVLGDPSTARSSSSHFYFETGLSYIRTFNDEHDFGIIAIYTQEERKNSAEGTQSIQLTLPQRNQALRTRVNYAYQGTRPWDWDT